MTDKIKTHAYLKKKLSLPEHYGENLDALWDCLSTDSVAKKILIINPDQIVESLGSYGESLLHLFLEAAVENEGIEVEIDTEKM